MSDSQAAQRQSFVRCELDRLEKAIIGLQNAIGNLNERLSMVLRQEESDPIQDKSNILESPEGVDVSRILARHVKDIHDCTTRIEEIVSRCEV